MRAAPLPLLILSLACSGGTGDDTLPMPEDSLFSLVVRTDFTDDATWPAVRAAIEAPVGDPVTGVYDFRAYVEFADDPRYDGLTIERMLTLVPEGSHHAVIFLVDQETLAHPDHPVLVVDLDQEPGRSFRVIPAEMWNVQNNLALANADWESYADFTDEDGVFRGQWP